MNRLKTSILAICAVVITALASQPVSANFAVSDSEPRPFASNVFKGISDDPVDRTSVDHLVVLTGDCKMQLVEGFAPCDSKVAFTLLGNGRGFIMFSVTELKSVFTLSGGDDRQPNLENYYLSIDTLRMKLGDEEVSEKMEGECHFNINRDGTKFFFVRCDVYNRAKKIFMTFNLEDITKTVHSEF